MVGNTTRPCSDIPGSCLECVIWEGCGFCLSEGRCVDGGWQGVSDLESPCLAGWQDYVYHQCYVDRYHLLLIFSISAIFILCAIGVCTSLCCFCSRWCWHRSSDYGMFWPTGSAVGDGEQYETFTAPKRWMPVNNGAFPRHFPGDYYYHPAGSRSSSPDSVASRGKYPNATADLPQASPYYRHHHHYQSQQQYHHQNRQRLYQRPTYNEDSRSASAAHLNQAIKFSHMYSDPWWRSIIVNGPKKKKGPASLPVDPSEASRLLGGAETGQQQQQHFASAAMASTSAFGTRKHSAQLRLPESLTAATHSCDVPQASSSKLKTRSPMGRSSLFSDPAKTSPSASRLSRKPSLKRHDSQSTISAGTSSAGGGRWQQSPIPEHGQANTSRYF